jgi:hypothetical protein
MLPTLRKRLKTISDGNKGLQDILRSMQEGTEILSVEMYNGKVHNTKITLQVDQGENVPVQERYDNRVHFYNRVALNKAIPTNAVYPKTTVEDAIEVLNLQYGCDFTEDDVEFIDGTLAAKEMSLGYYNAAAECTNIVDLNWYKTDDSGEFPAYEFQDWVVDLNPPLVRVGQKWNLSFNGTWGSLLRPGDYVSNSLYYRNIGPWEAAPETGWTKIVNYEPEHFQFKFIYVFKDNRIYDWNTESWANGFTKSGSFEKLLLGLHQTNNNVTVDSYSLEHLWTRYPELMSENYLEAVQSSIFGQDLNERFPQYEPIPEQDALVIEVNILYCPNPNCNPTSLFMQRFNNTIPETHQNGALTIQVVQNGTTTTQVVRPSQIPNQWASADGMIQWFAEGQGIVFVGGGGGFGQYRIYNRDISGSRNGGGDDGPTPPSPSVPNPTSIRIMKTQGEPVETDIFEWLLAAENELDAETLAEARSLGLSIRSCGTQYWGGL